MDRPPLSPRAHRPDNEQALNAFSPVCLNASVDAREVADHVLQRSRWTSSRSSGPGGQRRDKVETRAELTVDVDALEGLDADLAARLAGRLDLDRGPLRLTSQDDRSLARNQEIVAERLARLVAGALAPPPPPRRPTRPSRAQRQARLTEKTVRSRVKRLRRSPGEE